MRLRGTGNGRGMAIGTAAVVRMVSGIPLPPEIPPRILQEKSSGRNSELPDVIVVADELRTALAIASMLSWANVVGVVAERAESNPLPCPFPALTGMDELLEAIEDDMLLLLDAAGILLADPDPLAIAQYQAEAEQLAPKRRHFLENEHLPTFTQDGHTIRIIARVENSDEIAEAISSGADALYVPFYSALLPEGEGESLQTAHLLSIAEAGNGKPLYVEYGADFPFDSILEAAAKSDYTLVWMAFEQAEGNELAALYAELHEVHDDLQDTRTVAMPRLAAGFAVNEAPDIESLFAHKAERLIVRYPLFSVSHDSDLTDLVDLCGFSALRLVPVYFNSASLTGNTEPFDNLLQEIIGSSVSGMIVPAAGIMEIKAAIRELNFETCREMVLRKLSGEAGA